MRGAGNGKAGCFVGIVQDDERLLVLHSTAGRGGDSPVRVYSTGMNETPSPTAPPEFRHQKGRLIVVAAENTNDVLWNARIVEAAGPVVAAAFEAVTKR